MLDAQENATVGIRVTAEIRINTVDLGRARAYLRSVGSMCLEGSRSSKPRVVLTALQLLAEQRAAVRRLFERI